MEFSYDWNNQENREKYGNDKIDKLIIVQNLINNSLLEAGNDCEVCGWKNGGSLTEINGILVAMKRGMFTYRDGKNLCDKCGREVK